MLSKGSEKEDWGDGRFSRSFSPCQRERGLGGEHMDHHHCHTTVLEEHPRGIPHSQPF